MLADLVRDGRTHRRWYFDVVRKSLKTRDFHDIWPLQQFRS